MTAPIPIPHAASAPVANFITQFNEVMEGIHTVPSHIDGERIIYVDSPEERRPMTRLINMSGKPEAKMYDEVSASMGDLSSTTSRDMEKARSLLFLGISHIKGFFDQTVERVMRGERVRPKDTFASTVEIQKFAERMNKFGNLSVGRFPTKTKEENLDRERRAVAEDAFISSSLAREREATLPYLFASAILYAGLSGDKEAMSGAARFFFGSAKLLMDITKHIPAAIAAEFSAGLKEELGLEAADSRSFAAEAWLHSLDRFDDHEGKISDPAGYLIANFRGLWNASRWGTSLHYSYDSDPLFGLLNAQVSFNQRRKNHREAAESALRLMRARLMTGDHTDKEHWKMVAGDLSHAVAIWLKTNQDEEIFSALIGLIHKGKEITTSLA